MIETIHKGQDPWHGRPPQIRPSGRLSAAALVILADGGAISGPQARHLSAVLAGHRLATLPLRWEASSSLAHHDGLDQELGQTLDWVASQPGLAGLPVGLFGVGQGATAALLNAANCPGRVAAVVARGGHLGRTGATLTWLERIAAPTLLILCSADARALAGGRAVLKALRCKKRLEVVPCSSPHFDEPGVQDTVAALAAEWFVHHLPSRPT